MRPRFYKEVSLLAFDLLELSGTEVRKQPLVECKELLADLLKKVRDGIEVRRSKIRTVRQ